MIELYDYQKEDVAKMVSIDRVLNFNQMGYGKTVETCAVINNWRPARILIICPQPTIGQWSSKLKQICDIQTIEMPQRVSLDKRQVIVTNYEQIANGKMVKIGNNTKKFVPGPRFREFVSFRWDLVILDEAHRIKNRDSMTSRAVADLPRDRVMELTGTPIITRPDDLFHLLKWARIPGVDNGYWDFVTKYCEIQNNGFGKKPVGITSNQARVKELYDIMNPYLIRNEKMEWAGCRVDFISLIMTPKQTKLYKDISQLLLDSLPENCTVFNAIGQSMRLRQTTTVPEKFGLAHSDNIKIQWLLSALEDNPDLTMVVFSWFAEVVDNICEVLEQEKVTWRKYTGELNAKEKQKSKEDFISGRARVLVATIGAVGVGVDGLQEVCHTGVFFDRDWSPMINEQAESRLNRDGQKHFTNIYVLEARGTVDRHIGNINVQKAESVKEIFKYEERSGN
jgi:SNF2 family DNA or RNA helicase